MSNCFRNIGLMFFKELDVGITLHGNIDESQKHLQFLINEKIELGIKGVGRRNCSSK